MIEFEKELCTFIEVDTGYDKSCSVCGESFRRGILQAYRKYLRVAGFKVPLGRGTEYICYQDAEVHK